MLSVHGYFSNVGCTWCDNCGIPGAPLWIVGVWMIPGRPLGGTPGGGIGGGMPVGL